MYSQDTKRIAINTVILYIRMIIVMLIALYTSRLVLQALGVEDFGLYNVIGGVVGLFSFLRTSMEKATQRFLNVEMAKPDGRLNEVFCANLTIHIFIVIAILLLTETVGLWFLNTYIEIPSGREEAANWVYQSVVIALCLTVISVPYSACVIAHEKMTFYAVVSIIDAFLKLVVAFLLAIDGADKLVLYGVLMMLISLADILLYYYYCIKFKETTFRFLFDKSLYKEVFSFVSWTLVGQVAILGANQGNSILVNMFHSVIANAAMSIGNQVNSAVTSLTSSFQTAFNPQITKSYAAKDYEYLKSLVFMTSKISYLLLFIISLPIMFNIEILLKMWLGVVPENAGAFSILFLWNGILNALSAPLNFTVMASGKIRGFQIATAIVYLSDLFILYIFFLQGSPPIMAMYVKVSIMIVILFVRLYYAYREVPALSIWIYSKSVLFPLLLITIVSVTASLVLFQKASTVTTVIAVTILSIIISMALSFLWGLTKSERSALLKLIRKNKNKDVEHLQATI